MRVDFSHLTALLCLLAGCGHPPDATFTLDLRAEAKNPTQVEAIVTASDAAVWKSVTAKTDPVVLEEILSLRLKGTGTHATPLLGDFSVRGRELHFTPRFPLLAGEGYEARFSPAAVPGANFSAPPLTAGYQVPTAAPAAAPKLTAIYPTATILPANHLKFYLTFSEPMRTGEFLNRIKLLRADGREVPEPFRETELWSADGQRLTLWFHPGRQKTGVNLNVEIGPVLEPGGQYRLVVSSAWASQRGTPLGADVEKTFTTGPAAHARLDVNSWQIAAPRIGTREPLRVTFPVPLDWALLQNQLHVETAVGGRVEGSFDTASGETGWSFTPAQPWHAGVHRLAIGTVLEDLAGNSVAKPFEVDVKAAPPAQIGPVVYREFSVK